MRFFLIFLLLLVPAVAQAKTGTKVITVHKSLGWMWFEYVRGGDDWSGVAKMLDKFSASRDYRNIQITEKAIYFQEHVYEDVTKTVLVNVDTEWLKARVFYYRLGGEDRNTGESMASYSVFYSGTWAVVVTGGAAGFTYYYKYENDKWVQKNEPENGEGAPKDAPSWASFGTESR